MAQIIDGDTARFEVEGGRIDARMEGGYVRLYGVSTDGTRQDRLMITAESANVVRARLATVLED